MAKNVRYREISWKSLLLETDPSFYENSNPLNQTAYEFSNGRKFKGRRPYDNYTPIEEEDS